MKKLAAHLWSDQSGASAIELALVTTFLLVPLLLGATELGRRIWVKSELDNAVRVGMEYVMANYLAGSISGTSLQNAVRAGTSMGTAVTVSPPSACGSAYSCFGCLFGGIEYGRLLWTKNSIQYAVEQAARCAAMGQTAGATSCTTADATKTFAAGQFVGYTVPTTAFTVTYQCSPTPSAGCTACGVANTKGVLVTASVPFTPFFSSSHLLPFETSLSITLSGQSCRPIYT